MAQAWQRHNLLLRFGLISFLVIAGLGVGLVLTLRSTLVERTLADAERAAVIASKTAIQPLLTPADLTRDFVPLTQERVAELDQALSGVTSAEGIVRVKVWNTAHWIVYSDNPALRGRWFPSPDLLDLSLGGQVVSEVTDLNAPEEFEETDFGQLLSVYVPLTVQPSAPEWFAADGDGKVIGAFEVYLSYAPIAAQISNETTNLVLLLSGGLLLLWALLFRLVAGASRRLTAQARANRYLADHDPLTGLINRRVFADRIARVMGEGTPATVALLDLKNFQDINDSVGHSMGDSLLRQVATRLQQAIGGSEEVCRMGGDEFGLLLPGIRTADDARHRIDTLLQIFDQPFFVEDLRLDADASVGFTLSGSGPHDHTVEVAEQMVQRADIALYQARLDHRRIAAYDDGRNHFTRDRLDLAVQFRMALDRDQIELFYQPQLNLRTDRVHSVEALVRWRHPERGLLSPDEFLAVIEQSDLIRDLTARVLDRALYQLRCWRDGGMRLRMSINLSARDCTNPNLPGLVAAALEMYGLPADALTCELTESSMLTNPVVAEAVLRELADLGVEVAVDDFGTGYASLAYVRRMPVSELKIDRSFIMGLHNDGPDTDVVRFTTDLGRRLHLRVVAEGAETQEDIDVLREIGCQVVQGYYISRPMDGAAATEWLRNAQTTSIGMASRLPAPQRRAEIARALAAQTEDMTIDLTDLATT